MPVVPIDPFVKEIVETLRQRLEDAEAGKIEGMALVSVLNNGGVITDLTGSFSADPEDLAKLLGMFDLLKMDLYRIATEDDEDE